LGGCLVGSSADLSVDYEQNASNYGADTCDEVNDPSSEANAQKRETNQDQIYAKQNPFQVSHTIHPLSIE